MKKNPPGFSNDKKLYQKLAENGVRVFVVRLGWTEADKVVFIHANKTTQQWRKDIRAFLKSKRNVQISDGHSNGNTDVAALPSALYHYLRGLGYCDIDDVASDVYEGRVAVLHARIVDHPDHEEQPNGFGHYGLESK